MENPYRQYIREWRQMLRRGKDLPLGPPARFPEHPVAKGASALLFSPHPDDECITGTLPLRLMRENGMRIINVAVTQGSNRARQAARRQELTDACKWLGWELVATREGGLENINPRGRRDDPAAWQQACDRIREILVDFGPAIIFCPHEHDWNSSHIGTHRLVMDALDAMPSDFSCRVAETEFWAPMHNPNLMVEANEEIIADLIAGIACHAGEVERNPYHLSLPAWMQDNVRRGGEIVGGQGGAAPDFDFATLYRLRQWENGALREVLDRGYIVDRLAAPGKTVLG